MSPTSWNCPTKAPASSQLSQDTLQKAPLSPSPPTPLDIKGKPACCTSAKRSWTHGAKRVNFSTSYTGNASDPRREAGSRHTMCLTHFYSKCDQKSEGRVAELN